MTLILNLTQQLNNAFGWLGAMATIVNTWLDALPSWNEVWAWWTDWWGNILPNLTSWWNGRLLDIQSLIDTAFLDYTPFWEGWQDIRNEVLEFLSDPLDWIKTHVFEVMVDDFNRGFDRGLKGE